ncbi:MAG: hypothetical protein ACT4ON_00605 [Bacteroidota bacterium]
MITATKRIDELHSEHQLWMPMLELYADELKIYQKRLEETTTKDPDEMTKKQIEHFQNQFLIHKNELDMLNYEIKVHEQWLAKYTMENPTAIDGDFFADHKVIREKMEFFRKLYSDLKKEFFKFLNQRR